MLVRSLHRCGVMSARDAASWGSSLLGDSVPIPKKNWVAKSRRETVAGVSWPMAEQLKLEAFEHWRDRQRIQKRISHGRSAVFLARITSCLSSVASWRVVAAATAQP